MGPLLGVGPDWTDDSRGSARAYVGRNYRRALRRMRRMNERHSGKAPHPTVNRQEMRPTHADHLCAQNLDVAGEQIVSPPLQGIDREEMGSTWLPGASVIRHGQVGGSMHLAQCPSVIALRGLLNTRATFRRAWCSRVGK